MPSPITILYDNGGAVINKVLVDFFVKTVIAGCDLIWNYGDTCGAALTETYVSVTNAADPWQITAITNHKAGYSKDLCL